MTTRRAAEKADAAAMIDIEARLAPFFPQTGPRLVAEALDREVEPVA
jgi:hypothetical protein